jgi:hypothetical protein
MKSTAGTTGWVDIPVHPAETPLERSTYRTPNITDQYAGLLNNLTDRQRSGLIAKLSAGFYDGWRPTRYELIQYLQDEYEITPGKYQVSIAEHMPNNVDNGTRQVPEKSWTNLSPHTQSTADQPS